MLVMAHWMAGVKPTEYPGIWKTETGYRVRVRAMDPRSGMRKEANRHFEGITLKEAVKRQVKMRDELLEGSHVNERMRVEDFAKLWIKSKSAVVDEYTLDAYADALDLHVLPIIGKMYYDLVGHLEVQTLVNELLMKKQRNGQRYSRRSVKNFFDVFRNMTKDAIAHLNLPRDPTLRISFGDRFEGDVRKKKEKATVEECLQVLEAMKRKRPGSYALLHTKACTGQRFCHVSALKWGDIDFDAGLIRFRRKQVRGVVGPISKKKPVSTELPILPELAETLRAHKARLEKLEYPTGADAWVFPSRTMKLKAPNALIKAIAESKEEAGVTRHVTPHIMRYAFSDLLRRSGIDPVTRRAIVGHVTEEMQEHYSTVRLDEKREAMQKVSAELAKLRSAVKGDDRGDSSPRKEAA